MDRISAEHVRRNQLTKDAWTIYADHRAHVTDLLTQAAAKDSRLCVLGAGNCNDLDLSRLTAAFREVHLVDLDIEALDAAVVRQNPAAADRIHRHGGVDVTGGFSLLAGWTAETPPPDEELDAATWQLLGADAPDLPRPFDVAASVGLITQLVDSAALAVGAEHPKFVELLQSLRTRHIRLLLELLAPGGTAILTSEIVATDTFPELPRIPEHELAGVLSKLVAERNFFTGVNPFILKSHFEDDPAIAPTVAKVDLLPPWRWQFFNRMYAVCAVRAKTHAANAESEDKAE